MKKVLQVVAVVVVVVVVVGGFTWLVIWSDQNHAQAKRDAKTSAILAVHRACPQPREARLFQAYMQQSPKPPGEDAADWIRTRC